MSEAAWPVWQERDAQLRDVEAALAVGEDAIELHFRRANLLDETGRTEAAKQAYLAILHQAPTHAATLHLLGSLLNRTGYRRAARTVYGQAVACHPDDAQEHFTLANLLCEERRRRRCCHARRCWRRGPQRCSPTQASTFRCYRDRQAFTAGKSSCALPRPRTLLPRPQRSQATRSWRSPSLMFAGETGCTASAVL